MQRRAFLKNAGMLSASACLTTLKGFEDPVKSPLLPLGRFKLGVISDEFSQDLEEALTTMKGFGLEWVELRSLWGAYNTEATPDQLRRVKNLNPIALDLLEHDDLLIVDLANDDPL